MDNGDSIDIFDFHFQQNKKREREKKKRECVSTDCELQG